MPFYLPQRKSPRACWHDYTGADYFVTFCTKNRGLYFGNVVDGKMELSEIGKWALAQIEQTEMNRIADYIENNPLRWELDRFYKK